MSVQQERSSPGKVEVDLFDVDYFVGQKIRHRRKELGLSQQQLGDAVGSRPQQIYKYENGVNRVNASQLWAISQALGVRIDFFYDGFVEKEAARIAQSSKTEIWSMYSQIITLLDTDRSHEVQLTQFIRDFQDLDSTQRDAVFALVRAMSRKRSAPG